MLPSAKYTLGQLDSNVNTLRYDGEVNIGKSKNIIFFLNPFSKVLSQNFEQACLFILSKTFSSINFVAVVNNKKSILLNHTVTVVTFKY